MSKSKLSEACYDHDLKKVRALLAKGVPPNGTQDDHRTVDDQEGMDSAPIYFPLGEACSSEVGSVDTQLQIIEA